MEYTAFLWDRFGQSYDLRDQEVTLGNLAGVLSGGLVNDAQMRQRVPDELSGDWSNAATVHVPLRLSCVENIFADLSSLKCTLGDGGVGGVINPIYSYSQRNKDSDPEISAKWV